MKKKNGFSKRVLAVSLAAVILAFSGCAKEETKEVSVGTGEMPKELSVFASLGSLASNAGANDRGDILAYQIAEEKTGCKINWISPPDSARAEQFNLLIASGDLPDIIQSGWRDVTGGSEMYVEDGVIVPMDDYFDYMPNYKAFLDSNPEIAKQIKEADGSINFAACLRADDELRVFVGPTIRKDWLDKLGLEMPTNTDELYNVLKAFKTQDPNGNGKNDEIPMSGQKSSDDAWGIANLAWAFNTHWDFYVKDGKITHGILEPEMKPALDYIAKLYAEGLIDKDYLVHDADTYHGKVLNDKSGFFFGIQPSRYYTTLNDGTKSLAAVPYFDGLCYNPLYVKNLTGNEAAITTACKNPSGAAKWLDWFYSEEGITAFNFGIEGKTFNYEDGKRVLDQEYVFNNPDGLESKEVCAKSFIGATTDFPGLQLWEYYNQTLQPWGKDAIEVWTKSADLTNVMPNLTLTTEEKSEISDELTTIRTYISEQIDSIILGRTTTDELGKIKEQVNKMGMEKVLKTYNDAYVRYNK